MPYCVTEGIAITGIAAAVPRHKVLIDSYIDSFGKDDIEKFKKYTGICEVRRSVSEQTAGDLGFAAAERVLNKFAVSREKVGVLIFISQSPDYLKPATACVLQYRLGLSNACMAFDINLGCSGFVYGNQIMRAVLSAAEAEYGLLIVADTASKHTDQTDKGIAMLNGDAGTAVLYHKYEQESCTTLLETDGSHYRSLIMPAGGFRDPQPDEPYFIDADGNKHSKRHSYMDGMEVFNYSITDVPRAVKEYLQKTDKTVNDFSYILLHQANLLIMKQIARRIHVPMEKVPKSIEKYGNTNGASIPLVVCDNFGNSNNGEISILAIGFGIGLSVGVTSFGIDTERVLPVIETDDFYKEGRFL